MILSPGRRRVKNYESKGETKIQEEWPGICVLSLSHSSCLLTSLQKKSGRGSTSFTELLFRGFLLWFTIYTLSVCPQDEQLKSPVCRGLAEYRRLVIEPYILPPIQQALAHPSVVPYVEKAKPYADYAVRTAQPIAARVHKEFDARVVPQWNKRVVPLYFKYAVPQLMKLEAQTAPYRSRVEQEYERVLAPYVRLTASTLYRWQRKARPYVALAAEKTYQGYQVARPYARPVWEKVKIVLAQVAAILGEQRRQFVDPHVQKIWEHVKEMSGKPQASAPQLRSSGSSQLSKASSGLSKASVKVSSTLSSVASSAVSGSSAISRSVSVAADQATSVAEAVSSSVLPPVAQTTEAIKSSVAEAAESASDALKSTAIAPSSAVSQSVSSVVSAASDAVVSPASSLAAAADSAVSAPLSSAEAIPSVASSVAAGVSAAVSDAASVAGSVVSSAVASPDKLIPSSAIEVASVTVTQSAVASVPEVSDVPSIVASGQEEAAAERDPLDFLSDPDLEEFKAELGLSDDLLSEPEQPDTPVSDDESEQEREERLRARREKTARDRAELDQRHTEWEKKVESLVADSKKALRKALVAIRKAAVTELKENAEIQKEVESLVEDAEKFLRGAEKYMNNLQKENRKLEEKKAYWDRVVSKVEEKFQDRLRQTEAVVNGWYSGILDKELAEVCLKHYLVICLSLIRFRGVLGRQGYKGRQGPRRASTG